jgi:protein-glucosylgalactosylhydroxylysine glucosidase
MPLSRRNFLSGSAIFAGFALAENTQTAFRLPQWLLGLQSSPGGRIPRMVVENFSRKFDPAYLSNGLIGIRPGPNPLAAAKTQVGGFVMKDPNYGEECLAIAPYPLATDIQVGGMSALQNPKLLTPTRQSLDMATGELTTDLVFSPGSGVVLNVQVLQFASRSVPSLLCQEIRVTSSADSDLTFIVSISTELFPGTTYLKDPPEISKTDLSGGFASVGGISKLGASVWITTPDASVPHANPSGAKTGLTRIFPVNAIGGRPVRFQTIAAIVSDIYHPEPELEAIRLASWGGTLGFEELRAQNRRAWDELWQSRVKITGDADDQEVLDAAFFYLHSSTHASMRSGMGPYGLSQFRNYFGHSFWDTETWSLLPIILAAPQTARSLLEFRLRSLDLARRQAALYGNRGAQFPWEAAQTGGFETTPTCCDAGWLEHHSTPDVALAFWEYQLATNDQDFLKEGTWPVLKAVAEWIESRGVFTSRGFEILHIEGPDEGTRNINNNSYMNLICKMVLFAAIRCAAMVPAMPPASWTKIRNTIVIPTDRTRNVVLPYDQPPIQGDAHYSAGTMDFLTVHDAPIALELLRNTHNNEQAVQAASSADVGFATAAIAATSAFLGKNREAKNLFDVAWKKVWLEPFGVIRERPDHDYGCFLTTFGSLLQTAMLGFTGIRISEGDWAKYPASLPAGWNSIEINRIWMKGEPKRLTATNGVPAKLQVG